jgi:hypothetical protein
MFEKEIKFIIDFTLNRIKRLGSFFTFDKLASAEIHPAIILYISSQLDYLIYDDRKKLLQNSSFDYSGSEIAKYFNLIGEEIKKNKRLAFEDVKTLVTHAVTFNINYLVKPNWTLNKLIFDENKTRNVAEIRMMLNYLYFYDYIKNVYQGYFSKRKILSLDENEFGAILNKIDKQLFDEHTHDLIDNALSSIGEFFNEGGLNKTRISTQTVEVFLKEKNLTEELFKLRKSIPAEDKSKYEIEDIRKILYSKGPVQIKNEKPLEDEPEEEQPEQEIEEIIIEDEKPEEVVEDDTAEEEVIEKEKTKPQFDETKSVADEVREKKKDEDFADAEYGDEVIKKDDFHLEWEDSNQDEESTHEDNQVQDKEIGFEKEEENSEKETQDDFLSRYEAELKSLEELEAQLNSFSLKVVRENLSEEKTDESPKKKEKVPPEESDDNSAETSFWDVLKKTTREINLKIAEQGKSGIDREEIDEKSKVEEINKKEEQDSLSFEEIMAGKHLEKNSKEIKKDEEKHKIKDKKETNESDENDTGFTTEELVIEEEEYTPYGGEIDEDVKTDKEDLKIEKDESGSSKKKRDILSFLTDKEMERIVSNVFNEDEEDFVNTMENISESGTYEDATEIIKVAFLSYKIDPYSKDAVTFTNAVSNFFSQD